ncbi:MAG: BlaI/MecI/CopY family transcriptional regulator [Phycisphaerae bacterium]|jgi:predicted transcriptional regulator
MSDAGRELGKAELEALKVLWDHGPATVRQVLDRLREAGRRVAYTTVQTFLTRLEQKGLVRSDKRGLAHVFRARIRREQVIRSRLKELIDELYDGAAGPLVLQLLRSERLTADEIDALHELIERLDAESSS